MTSKGNVDIHTRFVSESIPEKPLRAIISWIESVLMYSQAFLDCRYTRGRPDERAFKNSA